MIVLGIFIVFANSILILTWLKKKKNNIFYFLDTAKTSKGFISLKAFRLTPEAIKMFKEGDFSPEYVKVGFQVSKRMKKLTLDALIFKFVIFLPNHQKQSPPTCGGHVLQI